MFKGAAVGLVVAVFALLGYGVYIYLQPKPSTTVAVVAKEAPILKKIPKKQVAIKATTVFEPEAKKKLALPPAVIQDETKQVTSATVIAPSERRVTVSSVVDTTTGETTTYTKQEPYPVFAVEARGEVRLDLGYKIDKGVPRQVGRLTIRHDFFQVKAVHAGVNLAIDTDGTAFAGVGIGYRW